jgi:LPXTG-motif cell wall-anchored protein
MTKLAAAVAAFLLVLTAMVAASPFASAGDYGAPSIGYEIIAGGQVRVTGDGCEANIDFSYEVVTGLPGDPNGGDPVTSGGGTTDAGGAFSFILDLDAGEFTVTVTCGDLVQVLGITVPDAFGNTTSTTTTPTSASGGATDGGASVEGSESSQGPLPKTGSAVAGLARLGAVLLAVGAGAGYLARKRRARTTAI